MHTPFFGAMNESRPRKLSRRFIWTAAVIAACLCPALALGQTNSSWNGGTGNWSNATDWTPNQVPNNGGGNTYNVTIGSSGGVNNVTLNQNATVNSLDVIGSSLSTLPGAAETLNITGNLTLGGGGGLDFSNGSSLTVGGNVTTDGSGIDLRSGSSFVLSGNFTGRLHASGGGNTLTLMGTYSGELFLGEFDSKGQSDVANIGNLGNSYQVEIFSTSTLNLTNQPNGITDVPQPSSLDVGGMIMVGSHSALGNLNSIEGVLSLGNDQTTTIAPTSGTLTLSSTGTLELFGMKTVLTISGNLNNGGGVGNGAPPQPPFYSYGNTGNTLNVTGTFTNQTGATLGPSAGNTINIDGALINDGNVDAGGGSTLGVGPSSINSGTIMLSGGNNHVGGVITAATAGAVLTNEKIIEGGGNIGNGAMGLVNGSTGTIMANLSTPLIIEVNAAGFQNNGTIRVNPKDMLSITGTPNSFLNFDSADGTLTGGTYLVLGTLEFDNANIVTNAANITLSGSTAIIEDQNGNNALANFAANTTTGIFTVESGQGLTTSVAFSNAGKFTIGTGSTFSVNGTNRYAQTAGTTTVSGTLDSGAVNVSGGSVLDNGTINTNGYGQTAGTTTVKGTLSIASPGGVNLSGGSILDSGKITTGRYTQTNGTLTVNGGLSLASPSGASVSGGSVFGTGTITGNIDLTGGLLSPGAASKKAGELTVSGTYAQSGAGALDVDLGGSTAGTQYDTLNITSTATLDGVLNVDLISGFKPTVGESFDIMNYVSETGTFTTTNLPKVTGDHWTVTYNPTDVVLTLVAGLGPAAASAAAHGAVSASPATRVSRNIDSSPVTCFAARLLGSISCGGKSVATVSRGGELHAGASKGAVTGTIHISAAGGASHETSASVTAMARLYACSYLPSGVAHTMGCH